MASGILEKLDSYNMYIPVVKALTNKELNAGHWKQIGEILGFEISPDDASINWTNLMTQGALNEENVEKISVLNAEAIKEKELVLFSSQLENMKVSRELFRIILKATDHPWCGTCNIIDKENIEDVGEKAGRHLYEIKAIDDSINGKDFTERCTEFRAFFEFSVKLVDILKETHLLWTDLVHQRGLDKEQRHQIGQSDETWRALLEDLSRGGDEQSADADAAGDDDDGALRGQHFVNLSNADEAWDERITEIRDVLKALKRGDDTRKVMRRMSRRKSSLASKAVSGFTKKKDGGGKGQFKRAINAFKTNSLGQSSGPIQRML